MEKWAPIEQFPLYEVSDQGRVRNIKSRQLLGQYDNGRGIFQVTLRRDNKNHARAVHRLVADAFLDPAPIGYVPMHIDGDRTNNTPNNLEWKSRSFAVSWTRQLHQKEPRDNRKVLHVKSGVVYDNALECARAIGGLENMVILTAQSIWRTTYKGSRIEFVDD